MEERTALEVAAIFAAAGDSVTVINSTKDQWETEDEYGVTYLLLHACRITKPML